MNAIYKKTNMKLVDYMENNYGWQSELRLSSAMSEIIEKHNYILDYKRHKDMIRNRALIQILKEELKK